MICLSVLAVMFNLVKAIFHCVLESLCVFFKQLGFYVLPFTASIKSKEKSRMWIRNEPKPNMMLRREKEKTKLKQKGCEQRHT